MKKFSRFITEAQDSLASQRAKKMGLKGDGHGGWYSASGEFVAKTEGGDLKFYNKGQRPGRDVPPDQQKKPKEPEKPQQEPASEDGGGGNKVTLVFGKFNYSLLQKELPVILISEFIHLEDKILK